MYAYNMRSFCIIDDLKHFVVSYSSCINGGMLFVASKAVQKEKGGAEYFLPTPGADYTE